MKKILVFLLIFALFLPCVFVPGFAEGEAEAWYGAE